jgi:RHS repeat-associated protein
MKSDELWRVFLNHLTSHLRAAVWALAGLLSLVSAAHAAVGRTPGTFSVSQSGSATYTIPIWSPPGPGGVQPNLALVYNSQQSHGYMGVGWSLAGLSSIYRCNLTVAQDGSAAPVTLSTADGYCLDGQRLVLTSGTYGEAGSTYQTEIANFANVTAYGAAGNGPASFVVQTRNGRTSTYGNAVVAPGTSTALSWQLTEVNDAAGNTMTIAYNTANGSAVPATISWTPTSYGSSTYNYTMTFNYPTGNVAQGSYSGYVAGSAVSNTNLLSSITVAYEGATVKEYFLSYQASPTTGREELIQVKECADSGASNCLAPTTMSYQPGSSGVSGTYTYDTLSQAALALYTVDVDGDGYPDLLYAVAVSGSTTTEHWYVMLGNGSGGYGSTIDTGVTTQTTDIVLFGDLAGTGRDGFLYPANKTLGVWNWAYLAPGASTFTLVPTDLSAANEYGSVLADVNGDGLPDLVYETPTDTTHVYMQPNATAPGGTVSFGSTPATLWTAPSGQSVIINDTLRSSEGHVRVVDFNGDGRADLIVSIELAPVSGRVDVYYYALISNGGSFSSPVVTPIQLSYAGQLVPSQGIYTLHPLPTVLDWNDDGCTDMLVSLGSQNPEYAVAISPCSAAVSVANWVTVPTDIDMSITGPVIPIDWDGDGRTDLLWCSSAHPNAMIALSAGSGIQPSVQTVVPVTADLCNSQTYAADLNGDGLKDIVTGELAFMLHNGGGQPPDLLSTVTDGYGNSASPTYASLTQAVNQHYFLWNDAVYPYQNYMGPLYLVGNVTLSDPSSNSGGTYSTWYGYAGAWMNLQGRGFSGFGNVQSNDTRNGLWHTSGYGRAFPYTGMYGGDFATQNNSDSTRLWGVTVTFANTPLNTSGYPQLVFAYASNVIRQDFELGMSQTSQTRLVKTTSDSYAYDSYGNATTINQTVTDNDASSPYYTDTWSAATTNTIVPPNTSSWCVNLLSESQVTYTASVGASVTRTRTFPNPDTTHCRYMQIVMEPSSSSYEVTETLGYDNFGNINSDAMTGVGMVARTMTANWGATGQFPMTVTDPTNASTTYNYNFSFGVRSSVIDANGLTTSWAYGDGFGRPTGETLPDLTSTVIQYNDCVNFGGCLLGPHTLALAHFRYARDGATILTDGTTYLDSLERPIMGNNMILGGGYGRVDYRYDSLGRLSQQSFPCLYTSTPSACSSWQTTWYDILNRPKQVQRPVSATNSTPQNIFYQYAGRTTTITDALSNATMAINDVNGWRRQTMDANGYALTFAYDAAGSQTAVTDSASNALWSGTYGYGMGAFLVSENDMDRGAWTYTVDALGERTAWKDPKTQTFSQTYDALSRPLTRSEPDYFTQWIWGATPASYNVGKLQSVCTGRGTNPTACTGNPGAAESDTYDSHGRLYQRAITLPFVGTSTFTQQFDATTGYLSSLTYPVSTSGQALVLSYGYQNGFLSSISTNLNAPSGPIYQANAMNAAGQITQETLGNGLVTNRNYDAVTGWLGSVQSGVGGGTGVLNLGILYDLVGNVTQRQDNDHSLTENLYYDSLYRLSTTSSLNGTQSLAVGYDVTGNITSRSDVASGATWTYDPVRKHAVTKAGSSSFTYAYDANGNMTGRQGATLSWSSYNYPTAISAGSGSTAESVSFGYGPDRQRYEQIYAGNGISQTTFYIGGLLELVEDTHVNTYRHYIYAGNEPVAVYSRTTTDSNTYSYLLGDHQGSVAAITDSSGALVVAESNTPFGTRRNPTTWSGAASTSDLTTSAAITRQGYTFQTAVGLWTGLNHMNGRVQDSITGRFLSADPNGTSRDSTQSWNRYSYVGNNPLSRIDPTGFLNCEDAPPGISVSDISASDAGGNAVATGNSYNCGNEDNGSLDIHFPAGTNYDPNAENSFTFPAGMSSADMDQAMESLPLPQVTVTPQGASTVTAAAGTPNSAFLMPVPAVTLETGISMLSRALGGVGMLLIPSTIGKEPANFGVFHYTNNAARDAIIATGAILPGQTSGLAWVTPTAYDTALAAQQDLSLNNPPDGYFIIPSYNLNTPLTWSPVAPMFGQPGGGIEGTTPSPIPVTSAIWVSF